MPTAQYWAVQYITKYKEHSTQQFMQLTLTLLLAIHHASSLRLSCSTVLYICNCLIYLYGICEPRRVCYLIHLQSICKQSQMKTSTTNPAVVHLSALLYSVVVLGSRKNCWYISIQTFCSHTMIGLWLTDVDMWRRLALMPSNVLLHCLTTDVVKVSCISVSRYRTLLLDRPDTSLS